jgi:hypothetical protein
MIGNIFLFSFNNVLLSGLSVENTSCHHVVGSTDINGKVGCLLRKLLLSCVSYEVGTDAHVVHCAPHVL